MEANLVYPEHRGKGYTPNYSGHIPLKHDGILTSDEANEIWAETGCKPHVRSRTRKNWQKVLTVHCLPNDQAAIAKLDEAVQKADIKIYERAMENVKLGPDGQPLRVPRNGPHHGICLPSAPKKRKYPQMGPAPWMMVHLERGGSGGMGWRGAVDHPLGYWGQPQKGWPQ